MEVAEWLQLNWYTNNTANNKTKLMKYINKIKREKKFDGKNLYKLNERDIKILAKRQLSLKKGQNDYKIFINRINELQIKYSSYFNNNNNNQQIKSPLITNKKKRKYINKPKSKKNNKNKNNDNDNNNNSTELILEDIDSLSSRTRSHTFPEAEFRSITKKRSKEIEEKKKRTRKNKRNY